MKKLAMLVLILVSILSITACKELESRDDLFEGIKPIEGLFG